MTSKVQPKLQIIEPLTEKTWEEKIIEPLTGKTWFSCFGNENKMAEQSANILLVSRQNTV